MFVNCDRCATSKLVKTRMQILFAFLPRRVVVLLGGPERLRTGGFLRTAVDFDINGGNVSLNLLSHSTRQRMDGSALVGTQVSLYVHVNQGSFSGELHVFAVFVHCVDPFGYHILAVCPVRLRVESNLCLDCVEYVVLVVVWGWDWLIPSQV